MIKEEGYLLEQCLFYMYDHSLLSQIKFWLIEKMSSGY